MTTVETRKPEKIRQTVTVAVTTPGDTDPYRAVMEALRGAGDVLESQYTGASEPTYLYGLNRERLIELAAWVAGEDAKRRLGLPSEWDQSDWLSRVDGDAGTACGTTCCIAGKVALDDGGRPVLKRYDRDAGADDEDEVEVDWDEAEPGWTAGRVRFPGQTEDVSVRDYARDALGLTDPQADRLFSGSNRSLDSILGVVGDLIREADRAAGKVGAGTVKSTRRLRPGRTGVSCPDGPSCDICYEDAPAGDDDGDDSPF